jgi:hypothetical protein
MRSCCVRALRGGWRLLVAVPTDVLVLKMAPLSAFVTRFWVKGDQFTLENVLGPRAELATK